MAHFHHIRKRSHVLVNYDRESNNYDKFKIIRHQVIIEINRDYDKKQLWTKSRNCEVKRHNYDKSQNYDKTMITKSQNLVIKNHDIKIWYNKITVRIITKSNLTIKSRNYEIKSQWSHKNLKMILKFIIMIKVEIMTKTTITKSKLWYKN